MTLTRIQGLLFILLGVVSSYDSWRIVSNVRPTGNFDAVGPDRYLLGLSVIMIVVGALLAARSSAQGGSVSVAELFRWPPPHFVSVLVIVTAFVWLMPYIGFTFSCLLFFLTVYRLLGEASWPRIVVHAVLTTAFIYVIFIYFSDMSLPKSPLGF
ncbi:MAG TPA: tripartite tricarboxylate transporter TctB family protein [Pseudorhodoplanes sp.]|nr:tripartite tricarboxylate transporter TctB family protein [Pseudorhodoplanes sp.]